MLDRKFGLPWWALAMGATASAVSAAAARTETRRDMLAPCWVRRGGDGRGSAAPVASGRPDARRAARAARAGPARPRSGGRRAGGCAARARRALGALRREG